MEENLELVYEDNGIGCTWIDGLIECFQTKNWIYGSE